jgi:hypothetical protein
MDMTRPDGRMAGSADPEFVKENPIRAEALFTGILALGNDIVRSARVGRLAPGEEQ